MQGSEHLTERQRELINEYWVYLNGLKPYEDELLTFGLWYWRKQQQSDWTDLDLTA